MLSSGSPEVFFLLIHHKYPSFLPQIAPRSFVLTANDSLGATVDKHH